ncbi:N-acetylglucosaminidase [Corticicoccus populi]|uniref:N-acetylmuramoyl-L-alanine amidase n=1 Tax=Corticicoccus populi TaxID=1812821 RepID=A0ABW5WX72_9STAP
MGYKNQLFFPAAIALSIITVSLDANADEMEIINDTSIEDVSTHPNKNIGGNNNQSENNLPLDHNNTQNEKDNVNAVSDTATEPQKDNTTSFDFDENVMNEENPNTFDNAETDVNDDITETADNDETDVNGDNIEAVDNGENAANVDITETTDNDETDVNVDITETTDNDENDVNGDITETADNDETDVNGDITETADNDETDVNGDITESADTNENVVSDDNIEAVDNGENDVNDDITDTADNDEIKTNQKVTMSETLNSVTNSNIEKHGSSLNEHSVLHISRNEPSLSILKANSKSVLPKYSKISRAARLITKNNPGIYKSVTNSNKISSQRLNTSTLYISEKAVYKGITYYKVHSRLNGKVEGWMKSKDLKIFNLYPEKKHIQKYSIKSSKKNDFLLSDPWGNKNQHTKRLSSFGNSVFRATKSVKIGSLSFYHGKIRNTYGWLQNTKLSKLISQPKYSKISRATRIKNKNSGIYQTPTVTKKMSSKSFNNSTLYVSEKAVYNGETYYKIHKNLQGPSQGWMKSTDLKIFNLLAERKHSKKYSIKPSKKNDFLLSDPWGYKNQQTKRLNSFGNSAFQTSKHIKIGALNFYYGKIGNQYGWLQDTKLTNFVNNKPQTKVVKYNQPLHNVLNTQMSLGAKPQAWNGNGGWRNATRNEVKQFLDTSNHKGGAWDYTFLNLDQSQGIAANTLNNNLLGSRGILTNQGNAFSQASRTHGVNEVYLISHAILETGHGQSQLSQGVRLDNNGNISNSGKKYYNMYGIGAVDHNAVLGGARYAQQMGWDTPAKAIIGGAQFVSQNYFGRRQNTLYSMRWNPNNPGTYQYATDVNWAYATARNIKNYYDQLGIAGRFFTRHEF